MNCRYAQLTIQTTISTIHIAPFIALQLVKQTYHIHSIYIILYIFVDTKNTKCRELLFAAFNILLEWVLSVLWNRIMHKTNDKHFFMFKMHFTKGSCVEMYYWMNVERWWNGRNLLTSIYEHLHLRIWN